MKGPQTAKLGGQNIVDTEKSNRGIAEEEDREAFVNDKEKT